MTLPVESLDGRLRYKFYKYKYKLMISVSIRELRWTYEHVSIDESNRLNKDRVSMKD